MRARVRSHCLSSALFLLLEDFANGLTVPLLGRCSPLWIRLALGLSESRYSNVGSAFASSPAKSPMLAVFDELGGSAFFAAADAEEEDSS